MQKRGEFYEKNENVEFKITKHDNDWKFEFCILQESDL